MTQQQLEAISSRLQRTTQGEWIPFVEGRDFTSGSSFIMTRQGTDRGNDIELIGTTNDDIDFIAHAKQDIPALIAEIKRLQAIIHTLK